VDATVEHATRIAGTVAMPGDKSIAHRALIFGAMARGEQVIHGLPPSEDLASTAACLRTLGARLEELPDGGLRIKRDAWAREQLLFAGNSGTTARLLAGLIAGTGLDCTIDGDASLRRRPMARIANPLKQMGATIETAPGDRLPMQISGRGLRGITYRLPVASAQVKSCILIAGLHAEGDTTVIEERTTRDHTENMLAAMGVPIVRDPLPGGDGARITVSGGIPPNGTSVTVPGDVSSAAFFVVAAALLPGSEVRLPRVGVNPTRTGALQVLAQMGARLQFDRRSTSSGEPVAEIIVRGGELRGVEISGAIIPRLIDELPILAVAATQATGTTTVRGAGELRHKESDRIRETVRNLALLGADITELDDGFVVKGPCRLRGHTVSSGGDHRIAMALAVAGLVASDRTIIRDSEAVGVSYPGFFRDLGGLVG
jgi:3-phosphoshikimate 1-carboxyvinyltransferase